MNILEDCALVEEETEKLCCKVGNSSADDACDKKKCILVIVMCWISLDWKWCTLNVAAGGLGLIA